MHAFGVHLKLLVPALAVLALVGCGGSRSATAPSSASTTTAVPAPTTTTGGTTSSTTATATVRVYFLRDGKVAPVARRIAATPAVARAALEQLLDGPAADERLTSAVPAGTRLAAVSLRDGLADVRLSKQLPVAAEAQLVYTLTQFPSVTAVSLDGGPGRDRSYFEGTTPQILVESPLPGATVTDPVVLRGTANTFEATFQAEVRDAAGHTLATDFVTATSGSGERGTFDKSLPVRGPAGPVTLVVYEVSANDGSHIHQVEIPLTLSGG